MAKGQRVSIRQVISTTSRNLGLDNPSQYLNSFIEWAMEAEMKIGSKDTYVLKERTYKQTDAGASGSITFGSNPIAGDTITIRGKEFIFIDTITDATLQIEIAGTLALTLTNLYTFLLTTTTGNSNPETFGIIFSITTSDTLNMSTLTDGAWANSIDFSASGDVTLNKIRLDGGADQIDNNRILLPADFYKIHDIKVDGNFAEPTIATFPSGADKENRYYIQGRYLYVTVGESDFEVSSADITTIVISYFGFEIAPDGYPTISAGHLDAVSHYLMYKLRSIDYYNGKLPRYLWTDMKMEWDRLCGQARGKDNMPSAQELRKIGKIWGSLVPVVDKLGKKWL